MLQGCCSPSLLEKGYWVAKPSKNSTMGIGADDHQHAVTVTCFTCAEDAAGETNQTPAICAGDCRPPHSLQRLRCEERMQSYPAGKGRRLPKAYSRVVSSKLSLSDFEVPLLTRRWVRIDRTGRANIVTVWPNPPRRPVCGRSCWLCLCRAHKFLVCYRMTVP